MGKEEVGRGGRTVLVDRSGCRDQEIPALVVAAAQTRDRGGRRIRISSQGVRHVGRGCLPDFFQRT